MLQWVNAVIMGVVEGLTEFLPVSSTGHLLLMNEILGFKGPAGNVFEIVVQLGAILAVVFVYFQRLWQVAIKAPTDAAAQRFILAVLVAFLPAVAIGAFAHGFIKSVLFNPVIVCISLLIGGFAILWIEKNAPEPDVHEVEQMPIKTALLIGLFQCVAMIPGVSRSGATIMGALMAKVDRRIAAEFSFFLAIPTMAAAAAYDIYKNLNVLSYEDSALIGIGFVTAFLSALIVVRGLIDFVSKHGFAPFAWYRIVIGSIGLISLVVLPALS